MSASPAAAGRLPLLFAALVTVAAAGWRLVDVTEWPFPFHTTVQYESALAARGLWVAASPAARTPDRAVWHNETGGRHVVSPPVLPALAAGCYVLAGEEVPWVSKLFTAAFWLAGGWFVGGAVVRQTGSRWAGAVTLAWFVFAPYGLMLSRSFQTEPLAVCGLAFIVWHLSKPGRPAGWRDTAVSGLVCGLAAAVKPGVFLPIVAAGFAGGQVSAGAIGSWRQRFARVVGFTAVLAAPSVGYAVVWLRHRGSELRPDLLADPGFYTAVAGRARHVVGDPGLVLGFLGVALAARSRVFLPAGLFAGYFAYVGLFTYHCSTHDYYHAPLLVTASVGIGWTTATAGRWAGRFVPPGRRTEPAILAAAVAGLGWYVWASRLPFVGPWRLSPAVRAAADASDRRERERADDFAAVREAVRPARRVVAVAEEYGYPLEYGTDLRVTPWPRGDDAKALGVADPGAAADDRLAALIADGHAALVVTDFGEFAAQPALRAAVERRGAVTLDRPGVRVYGLR